MSNTTDDSEERHVTPILDPRGADARLRRERKRPDDEPARFEPLKTWLSSPRSWRRWSLLLAIANVAVCAIVALFMVATKLVVFEGALGMKVATASRMVQLLDGRRSVPFFIVFFVVAPALQGAWLGAALYFAARFVGVTTPKPRRRPSSRSSRRRDSETDFSSDR